MFLRVLLLCIIAVVGYFLGNLNGALIASRYVFHKDIRKYGSGNAGLTNYVRVFGKKGVGLLLGIDIGKTVVAVLIGWGLMAIVGEGTIGRIFAGFCAMLGHAFPVLYGFRGGKCALAGVVVTFMTHPGIGFTVIIVAGLVILFTRYVSLGSIVGAAIFPLLVWFFDLGGIEGVVGLLAALLLIFMHRSNIVRLVNGTESRLRLGKRPEKKLDEDEF